MFRVLFTLGFLSLESEQKQTPGNTAIAYLYIWITCLLILVNS